MEYKKFEWSESFFARNIKFIMSLGSNNIHKIHRLDSENMYLVSDDVFNHVKKGVRKCRG